MSNLIDLKEKFFIAGSKGMVGSAIKRTLSRMVMVIRSLEEKY